MPGFPKWSAEVIQAVHFSGGYRAQASRSLHYGRNFQAPKIGVAKQWMARLSFDVICVLVMISVTGRGTNVERGRAQIGTCT